MKVTYIEMLLCTRKRMRVLLNHWKGTNYLYNPKGVLAEWEARQIIVLLACLQAAPVMPLCQ